MTPRRTLRHALRRVAANVAQEGRAIGLGTSVVRACWLGDASLWLRHEVTGGVRSVFLLALSTPTVDLADTRQTAWEAYGQLRAATAGIDKNLADRGHYLATVTFTAVDARPAKPDFAPEMLGLPVRCRFELLQITWEVQQSAEYCLGDGGAAEGNNGAQRAAAAGRGK